MVRIGVEEPAHPLNQGFPAEGFDYADEYFRFDRVYSRDHVRVLLSMDRARTDVNQGPAYGHVYRFDGDYPIAWIKSYGRGESFIVVSGTTRRCF